MPCKTNAQKVKNINTSFADYDKFAPVFNEEWGDFGSGLSDLLCRMAGGKIPEKAKILDLCCGTGQLAKALSEKGYQVIGLDGSPEMLRFAKINAPKAEFVLTDARTFQLPAVFDVVFCTFDSLNHLMSSKDLILTFQNVYRCLVAGGVFLFDLNTLKTYLTQWQGYLEVRENPDRLVVNRAYYDPQKRIGQTHCVIFIRQDENWRRTDVRLYQKCYAVTTVQALLQKAGFAKIHKYALNAKRGYHQFTEEDTRVFFKCIKR
jgi:SAM-dependent methyltransferase